MIDQSHLRQSSPLTAIPKIANRPHRSADRMVIAGRRDLIVLLASGVAISTWALFPSTVESGIYVPPPEASTPSAADVKSAREGVVGGPVNAYRWINANLVSSKPTMYGPTAWYPSPVANVSQVSVRSKLQALLMMLYSQSGVVDPAALEAKLQALLTLPDSVLAQLMEHPDLADLNKTLDAVFLGATDLSGVKTELDKIDVTSVPGPSEKIDVVKVNGKPAYIVHTSAVQMRTVDAAGSPVSALPPPGGPVTVTVLSLVQAPASLSASAFAVAPTSEQLAPPPAPASLSASAFTVAPTSEQLAPPPAPASPSASAFALAPSSEQLPPPPAPAELSAPAFTAAPSSEQLPPRPAPSPTPETPKSQAEPTGTRQTSNDVMTSREQVRARGHGGTPERRQFARNNSPATNSPATQSAAPSTPATGRGSPAGGSGVRGGGTAPSNNESGNNENGGTSSGGGTSP